MTSIIEIRLRHIKIYQATPTMTFKYCQFEFQLNGYQIYQYVFEFVYFISSTNKSNVNY